MFEPHEFFGWFPALRGAEDAGWRDDSDALIQALKEQGARDLRGR